VRRSYNLEKLKGVHYQAINLHLMGKPNREVAEIMQKSLAWVSTTLNDPLVKQVISSRFKEVDDEFRALMPLAVGVIRQSMLNPDPAVQLSAADKWFRANGFYQAKTDTATRLTAEDIVKQLLEGTEAGQVSKVSIVVDRTSEGKSE
jgi:hypothetical protein